MGGGAARSLSRGPQYKLNAVCPYYTMFPLEFPLTILKQASQDTVVFDPFCGRGTTNYAAQTLGIASYGHDSSPIAVAIAKAKLAVTDPTEVLSLMGRLLEEEHRSAVPQGEFWEWAFHPETLQDLCKLREGLMALPETDASIMLRAILMGCLHGPLTKDLGNPSYFSNQMPRTFASKPEYSIRYWKQRGMNPRFVDVRIPIRKKVGLVLGHAIEGHSSVNNIRCVDSRDYAGYRDIQQPIDLVISSPPYYGMRTYVQDQWLRHWLIGGPETIAYEATGQVDHLSPKGFAESLSVVWDNIYNKASDDVRMVIRFGGLASRKADYDQIFRNSIEQSAGDWYIYYSRNAGNASRGRRQADVMGSRTKTTAIEEKDYFIRLRAQ
ncbi:MAG: hypothetical protein DWQ09_02095 [Proteobacteria bacterium]|nr:MAG: hypothetical protein DWQ09_02095 [Pseudomonadota bacterium]QKK11782.1 MAG: hypothetical protein HND59_09480 [Pseudomonadota bacterium]